jgi:ankyrin repeat protein
MSQAFLKLIQTGRTAEITAAVEDDPGLVASRDPQGVSTLLWSVYAGQTPVRDYLLERLSAQGIELDIFEAAAIGDAERLRVILKSEPGSVDAFSGDGWTPLHLAAAFGTPAAVQLLLQNGGQIDAVSRNPQRNQPLHAAVSLSRNPETVRLLLRQGASANAIQVAGFTPLFSVAAANRRDLAELLIAHGADCHHRNDAGKTAAEFARERGYEELAGWLEAQPV